MRGGDAELAADGAWLIANGLVNLELCATSLGKKDTDLAPASPEGED